MDAKDALFECLEVVKCLPVLGRNCEELERVRWLKRTALKQMLVKVREVAEGDPRLKRFGEDEG